MAKLRCTREVRDLRDETWMIREGLAEIEREQQLHNCVQSRRYEISQIPYLGTDGKGNDKDHAGRKIYADDSDYIKLCKQGGHKSIIWWYPDFPVTGEVLPKERRLLRPKPVEWSVHPESLLPSKHEEWLKNRKCPPTQIPPRAQLKTCRLEAHKLPPATGATKEYTTEWEPELRREPYSFAKIIKNGYVEPWQIENKKRAYFESLFDRPQNEQEKLALNLFLDQRKRNNALRETTNRFDRLTRGQPSWTTEERCQSSRYMFPRGYGRGCRPPILVEPKRKAHDGC